jgi:hypothetical protein
MKSTMKNKIHIVPHDGEWAIRISGCDKPVATEPTQQAAIELAMGVAADEEMDVVVHRRDGSFRNFIHLENIERRQAAAEAARRERPFGGISGKNRAWGIFAVGAVTGLAVYLALNPPREAQRLMSKIDKGRPDWLRW